MNARSLRLGPASFASAAIVCFSYGVCALITLHVLRPDYAPPTNFISNYAVGRYGWIMTSWFLAMSSGLLMLIFGLSGSGLRSIAARLALFLLCVASIGLVVSAIFPTDIPGAPSTRSGNIHDLSFLVNVGSIMLAMVLLSAAFGVDSIWRTYRRTAWALTALVLVAFVIQFLTLHKSMPYGLANRLLVAALFAWLLTTSRRLQTIVSP